MDNFISVTQLRITVAKVDHEIKVGQKAKTATAPSHPHSTK